MSGIRLLLLAASALAFASLYVAEARAEVEVRSGPSFLILEGASGVDGCLPRDLAKQVMRDRVLAANEAARIDPQIAVVFSLEVPPCADIFYAPVSNDIRGIGYQHLYAEETFDESPDAALEGVAFLNDVPYWEAYPEELRRAFLHEVGHRWGVRVHVAGDEPTALLGRDNEHFSYFLDTSSPRGVSPLEGNVWRRNGAEFVSETEGAAPGYSDLDLYLMGVKAPEEVAPFRLLIPDEGQVHSDCSGAVLDETSPPQRCEPLELGAREQEFSIADVLEVEGARFPAAVAGPVVVDAAFYFLSSGGVWTTEGCRHWEREVAALEATFEAATGGKMFLSNVVSEDASCDQLLASLKFRPGAATAPFRSSSGDCAVGRRSSPSVLPLALLLSVALRSRRRHKKVPG